MILKHIITGLLVLTSAMSSEVMARCLVGDGWTRVTNLSSALGGKTACSLAGDTQEEHHADGELWDYKCGDTDPATPPGTACAKPDTDRRRQVGTWEVTGPLGGRVSYSYTAFGNVDTGPFIVFVKGGIYDFCTARLLPSNRESVGQFSLLNTTGSRVCP